MIMNDDKPFVCPEADCGMRFTNEDHLNVHSKKHEMSLALNAGGQASNSPAHHFLDQTPTPTKFLKNCEEIGLFQELTQNPFDHAYKKALDNDPPIPGPQTTELNTPTLILSDSLKNSTSTAVTTALSASPLSLEKSKGSEPLKPSPLAKTTTGSKLVLDLSGKNVMTAQPSSSAAAIATASVKRHLISQDADSTSSISPAREEVLVTRTDPVQLSQPASSTHLLVRGSASQHSTPNNVPSVQAQLADSSSTSEGTTTAPNAVKREPNLADGEDEGREHRIKKEPGDVGYTDQQQQCTMQVLLQLPNGETVPISIPATISKVQYLSGQQSLAQPQPQLQQASQHQPPPLQHQPPPLQPAPAKTTASSSLSTTMALKQRLKAQLQGQHSPSAKTADLSLVSSNPAILTCSTAAILTSSTTAATPNTTSGQVLMGSTSPIMMVDSPNSEMNLSDSSDYSVDSKRQKMSPENGDPEERRRKFLERNRAAAARCRQKRKHWISNLEKKADELQSTNARLQSEVKLLRGEVAQLKTLLLAHKDCPVTQQQRSQGQLQHIILTDPGLSSQDLAQVVPTGEVTADPIQIGQTFVTFLRESVGNQEDPETSNDG